MTNSPEGEGAIHVAEAILKEAQRGEYQEFTLYLKYSEVYSLWNLVRFHRLIPTIFKDIDPEVAAQLHRESMSTVVNKKVRMAFTTDPTTGRKIKKNDPKSPVVPLVLTTREMDFLIKLPLKKLKRHWLD